MVSAQSAPKAPEAAAQPAADPAVARAELRLIKLARLSDKQLAALNAAKDADPEDEDVFAELKTGRKARVRILDDLPDPDPRE